ncbi:MAG TPA: glucose 1-dehydrogenase [Aliidongia sp.]|uniref:SDR family NAD(P)-dependent oxidoreductase n=1 Tax=Aliidongia sp. TaxID=1914230 RepID=UPI002DDDB343|nr:glucose 1-dehydrogenase [Aliidongia sp.]HEV2673746.1 glucose 1-dehydrogenase [Aliidongia sp.]
MTDEIAVTGRRLAGKCCFITGAASGLGKAMALAFAAEGAQIAVADRNEAAGRAVAALLGSGFYIPLDVTDETQWTVALGAAVRAMGRLDVLVNNAGVVASRSIEETTLEEWRFVNSVNVEGTFLGCKHGIPHLRASGGGAIINISSVAGITAAPMMAAYSASKGAVRALTKTVAIELARKGDQIRCNSIHPVFFQTPMLDDIVATTRNPDKFRAGLQGTVPLGRFGQPEEVAAMALYLASDEARFVTGAEFAIDGGFTAA